MIIIRKLKEKGCGFREYLLILLILRIKYEFLVLYSMLLQFQKIYNNDLL